MKNNEDKRLTRIELILEEIKKNLLELKKDVDMTQKIVHVETATNTIRIEQELKKKIVELHNEDLNKLDHIVGELQTLREENTIGTYQTREIREEFEEYKKRLEKLEKLQHIS